MSRRGLLSVALATTFVATSCAFGPQFDQRSDSKASVTITVLDEDGRPNDGASVTIGDDANFVDGRGEIEIDISEPVTAVVEAPGALVQPVIIDPADRLVEVRLWSRLSEDGVERNSVHFGGDVMMGRRFVFDDRDRTPDVIDKESARGVVSDLAPLSSSADVTMVNLETVIGDHDDSAAAPGKRFLLQSDPVITSALEEMGVDVAILGNNHAFDWGEIGVDSTFAELQRAGLPYVGAGHSRDEATEGIIVELGDTRLGLVSFTTINGNLLNDGLPLADDVVPDDAADFGEWRWEERFFEYGDERDDLYVAPGHMRIGTAWRAFSVYESELGATAEMDAMWNAMVEVFPELQDWVARRGHGGAAPYERRELESNIAALREQGADLVVVQAHGGFQYAQYKSEVVQKLARTAVDVGADAVIAHHPHVVQGYELYNDALIAYSLGNLVFDQDLLPTFMSQMLRIVFEGDEIIEARIYPVMLDSYRTVPASGAVGEQILRTISARSSNNIATRSGPGQSVMTVARQESAEGTTPLRVRLDNGSGVIEPRGDTTEMVVNIQAGTTTPLPSCAVVRSDLIEFGIELGTDLFDWGSIDDHTADDSRDSPMHVGVPADHDRWARTAGAEGGDFDDAITVFADTDRRTSVRFGARARMALHDLFDDNLTPLDSDTEYEVNVRLKRSRGEQPVIRVSTYGNGDPDPASLAPALELGTFETEVEVPDDGKWHLVTVKVPADVFEVRDPGFVPTAIMVRVDAPPALRASLSVDDLQLLEWRGPSAAGYENWVEADAVRSISDMPVTLTTRNC